MYIDPRGKVLAHLDRLAGWQDGRTPAPVTVEWDLSNRCSLGCQDCHFAHTHSRGPWTMKGRTLPMAFDSAGDLADLDLVMRGLSQMAAAGVKGVVWSGGGEPTLHPRWSDAVAWAHACGLEQGMYTLGGHLTAADAAFLAERASWVVVSLDAVDAETYAHDKGVAPARFAAACDGIVHLVGHKAAVGVSFLLHGGNVSRAWEMVALARALGATYTTFRPAIRVEQDRPSVTTDDRAWIAESMPLLRALALEPDVEIDPERFAQYGDWQGHGYSVCKGIRLNTTITPDGRVWVCPQRRGVTAIGDLRTEAFADLWSRHTGQLTVDDGCRVMCRLHPVNEVLAAIDAPRAHEAFL